MNFAIRLSAAIVLFLVLVSGASALEIGGGSSASIGADSSIQGSFQADKTGASTQMGSSGTALYFIQNHFVEDSTGKRAEMYLNVTNSIGCVGYRASFSPMEGMLGTEATKVSATQTVYVAKADSIKLHAAARSSAGSDVAGVNLTVNKTGTSPASFSGSTLSKATATSALANIQGKVAGAVNGSAGYGGSFITGPYTTGNTRDSTGQRVEGSLVMQASSIDGSGTISGVSTFNVNPAEKIQAAINASWDGDTINVAKGTYIENLIIGTNLIVKGAGSGKTIVDGMMSGTVITIPIITSKVSLSGMTIQNGSASNGGGILNAGTLTLKGSTISGNSANTGGGIMSTGAATLDKVIISGNYAGTGGGILSVGTAKISSSTISENSANTGGGIQNQGSLTIDKSVVSGNVAQNGGGIINLGALSVTGSKISKNNGGQVGGGILSLAGIATVSKSSVSENYAATSGGGIYGQGIIIVTGSTISGNNGGGIFGQGILNVFDSTINGNTGGQIGSGITGMGTVLIANSKITGNKGGQLSGGIYSAGTVLIDNSKITGNTGGQLSGGICSEGAATITGSTVSENTGSIAGGIYSTGILNVYNSQITGNTGGIYAGGIYSGGILNVYNSQITKNTGGMFAGGIYSSGTTTLTGSTVSWNTGSIAGGVFGHGETNITKSTIYKNSGSYGGGIYINGNANVTGSTISSNYASINGGGICIGGYPGYSTPGAVTVRDSIVSSNIAGQNGGGIYNVYTLNINGTSQIRYNKANAGYGGGIYSTASTMAFNGTRVFVKGNKAYLPQSAGDWYQGYGVYASYASSEPTKDGGFNPTTQVTGNSKA